MYTYSYFMNWAMEADLFIQGENIFEFVGKAEIYITYQMKTFHFFIATLCSTWKYKSSGKYLFCA